MSSVARIEVRDAVASALEFARSLLQHDGTNFRLEEVWLSDDGAKWFVTVGYDVEGTKSPLEKALYPEMPAINLNRVYKIVELDAQTGTPGALRIRKD